MTSRIRQARAAFAMMRPLLMGSRGGRRGCMRKSFAQIFGALVVSVMLNSAGVWALPPDQLERLEVCLRRCLRSALPPREHRRFRAKGELAGPVFLHNYFRVPTVATLLARAQLRWLGHVLRMDESRVPRVLLDARRVATGPGAGKGCHGETLMGVYGNEGVYQHLVNRHLTSAARTACFRGTRERSLAVLAADKAAWKKFVNSVIVF